MFTTAEVLILLAAVAGSGSMVGFIGWTLYRLRRLERRDTGSGAFESLTGQMDTLRDELESVHGDVAKLKEQADFTERLLTTKSGSGSAEREGHGSP